MIVEPDKAPIIMACRIVNEGGGRTSAWRSIYSKTTRSSSRTSP